MRGFLNGLVLGIILGAAGYWFAQKKAAEHPEAQQNYEQAARQLKTNATAAAHDVSDALHAKMETLGLRADQITDELKKKGEIVRRKAKEISDQAVNATSDAEAVTKIKAKYLVDPSLSAWDISVSCAQGHVTLSGTVSSPEDIGRAVTIALDADGVRDVTSTLTIKPKDDSHDNRT